MEDIKTVPTIFCVDEFVGGGDIAGCGENALAIAAGKGVATDYHER